LPANEPAPAFAERNASDPTFFKENPMNVIVLVNDSYRMDHVGCYNDILPTYKYHGGKVAQSPRLDEFAAKSARFNYAFPEGLPTLPVRTACFTGRYTFPFRGWGRIEPSDIVVAEILWDKGYHSCLVTDAYHMHKPGMAYERGFDEVRFIRGQEEDPQVVDTSIEVDVTGHYKADAAGKDKRHKGRCEQYLRNIAHWRDSDEDQFMAQGVKKGIEWLEQNKGRDDLFLWLDCFDPHEPWNPPTEFAKMYTDPNYDGTVVTAPIPGEVEGYMTPEEVKHTMGLYAGKCTMCDKWDGIFFDALEDMGFMENTMIIFLTDHGEPFGEHEIICKAKGYPYEELVRIPFIVYHPDGIGSGQTFDQLLQTCDVAPTILDCVGVDTKYFRMHGQSILPIMKGEQEKIRDHAYVGHWNQSVRINDHEWAFINYMLPRDNELYKYVEDKEMKNNIIAQHPEKAMELELIMRRFCNSMGVKI
jgi:arylsulfatase A-like enzyme